MHLSPSYKSSSTKYILSSLQAIFGSSFTPSYYSPFTDTSFHFPPKHLNYLHVDPFHVGPTENYVVDSAAKSVMELRIKEGPTESLMNLNPANMRISHFRLTYVHVITYCIFLSDPIQMLTILSCLNLKYLPSYKI